MNTYTHESIIPASAEKLWAYHVRPGAFERLTPPWEPVELVDRGDGVENGSRAVLRLKVGPVSMRWIAEHHDCVPPTGENGGRFTDVQIKGPFAHWSHTHSMENDGETGSTRLRDAITFALPLGSLGRLGLSAARRKIERMFRFRHAVTAADLAAHGHVPYEPKKILITGASGLVGSTLVAYLTTAGHDVWRLVRPQSPSTSNSIPWDPAGGALDARTLEGFDAVVHLAGEGIATGRWTQAKKERIRTSRVVATRQLAEALASLDRPPSVFISASAIGYYGERGAESLTEAAANGTEVPATNYLAAVCREWEEAAQPASDKGIRVVHPRFGMILSPRGGALARMLTPFRFGAGGRLGSGTQYMSWVAIDDVAGAIHEMIRSTSIEGPANVTAPEAVTNTEFTKTLARVLRRPAVFPMPAAAARAAFGEVADALLLASTRVEPAKLVANGFEFAHPDLERALRHMLGR